MGMSGGTETRKWAASCLAAWLTVALQGCSSTMPSDTLQNRIQLPVPQSTGEVPKPERLSMEEDGELFRISPRTLIPLAFNRQPDISSSYERFRSEEARYDFFYTSRDALTPRMRVSNSFDETRADEQVARHRDHTVEVGLEKRFFDTTRMDVSMGYETVQDDDDIGNRPFLAAALRYPLWVSREKLERTSEDIFRRNELDDAQLAYIQEVRSRLEDALFRFHDVASRKRLVDILQRWLNDLRALKAIVEQIEDRDVATDLRRVDAEIERVAANLRTETGWYEIQMGRLKGACGVPFHAHVELIDSPFNPFEGFTHAQLLQLSIETDPEIATLRNSVRNAEVQLDLAQRGKWDMALLLNGTSGLEGRGMDEGTSDWSVSVGLDLSAIDPRVTDSLTRQAQANIQRFTQAIAARENAIFVDTLEPIVRLETVGKSRHQLLGNLPRYVDDYTTGIEAYRQGTLNIDDLLKRRENIYTQENEISQFTFLIGANVAELCAATGKFFDLLNGEPHKQDGAPPAGGS